MDRATFLINCSAFLLVTAALLAMPVHGQAPPSSPPSGPDRPDHLAIRIGSDSDFLIPANGVRSGSGTETDPYVISDWNIRDDFVAGALPPGPGIEVRDVTSHFVLRNLTISGFANSIRLDATPPAVIEDTFVAAPFYAILGEDIDAIRLTSLGSILGRTLRLESSQVAGWIGARDLAVTDSTIRSQDGRAIVVQGGSLNMERVLVSTNATRDGTNVGAAIRVDDAVEAAVADTRVEVNGAGGGIDVRNSVTVAVYNVSIPQAETGFNCTACRDVDIATLTFGLVKTGVDVRGGSSLTARNIVVQATNRGIVFGGETVDLRGVIAKGPGGTRGTGAIGVVAEATDSVRLGGANVQDFAYGDIDLRAPSIHVTEILVTGASDRPVQFWPSKHLQLERVNVRSASPVCIHVPIATTATAYDVRLEGCAGYGLDAVGGFWTLENVTALQMTNGIRVVHGDAVVWKGGTLAGITDRAVDLEANRIDLSALHVLASGTCARIYGQDTRVTDSSFDSCITGAVIGGSDRLVVRGLRAENVTQAGIEVSGSNGDVRDLDVRNNQIGVASLHLTNATLSYIRAEHNREDGIRLGGGNGVVQNVVLQHNRLLSNGGWGVSATGEIRARDNEYLHNAAGDLLVDGTSRREPYDNRATIEPTAVTHPEPWPGLGIMVGLVMLALLGRNMRAR